MEVSLSIACGTYEITRALVEGSVRPDGVELIPLTGDSERIYRTDRRNECNVSEYNVFAYMRDWEAGDDVVAIPVFPHRRFRHGSIFVAADSDLTSPAELAGARIGIGGYEPAAAVWLRGILQEHYGVDGEGVDWVDVFGRRGRVPDDLDGPLGPEDPMNRFVIDRYLADGRIDALLSAYNPAGLGGGSPTVRRLIPDSHAAERDYYLRTGIFPIMHVVTVRRSLVEKHPWLPASLTQAFTRAKQKAYHRLKNPRALPLAFGQSAWSEQERLMGPDPWQYGLTEANRKVVDVAIRYAAEQGFLAAPVTADELFAPVDLEAPPGYEIR